MSKEEVGTYGDVFGEKFQKHILSILLRVQGVVVRYRSALSYTYFVSDLHRIVARALLEHCDSYRFLPTEATLIEDIRVQVDEGKMEHVEKALSSLYKENITDAEAVKKKIVEFGKIQAAINAVIQSAEKLEKGDRNILPIIQESLLVGEDILDIGTDYVATFPERDDWYAPHSEELDVIPTGIYHLDKSMGGGLCRGELGVVLAPPKRGKCVAPYAPVWTPESGYLCMREVCDTRPSVFGISSTTQLPCTAAIVGSTRDTKKRIARIKLRSGREICGLAETHPLLTQRGWLPPSLLRKGDYVVSASKLPLSGTCSEEDLLEAWLHGVMCGDGGLTGDNPTLHLHQVDDLCIVKTIEHFFSGLIGSRFDDSENGCRWLVSRDYYKLSDAWGIERTTAPHKSIARAVWEKGEKALAAFVAGLFDTDGTVYFDEGRPRVEFTFSSHELACDVLTALHVFGVYASIRERSIELNGEHFSATTVTISDGEGILTFYDACAGYGVHDRKWVMVGDAQLGRGQYYHRLPHTVWEEVIRRRGGKTRWDDDTIADLFRQIPLKVKPRKASGYVRRAIRRRSRVSPDVARVIGSVLSDRWIQDAASGAYAFDEVKEVLWCEPTETLDIEVEESAHTFMVDGVFTHNTTTLINFGFGAIVSMLGLKVVHYSNEIIEESQHKVSKRYDDRLAGKYVKLKHIDPHKYAEVLRFRAKRFIRGGLFVKSYPTRTAGVSTLRNHLSLLASRGFKPDLVIADYADIMKPERRLGDMRHEQAGIYEDLRGLAGEFDCAIWTGSQTPRGALEKDVITLADFAEAFEKAAIVDAAVGFCLQYAQGVVTNIGTVRIGDIGRLIRKGIELYAWSHNFTTGEDEWRPILNWFNNGVEHREFVRVRTEVTGRSKGSVTTEEHEYFTVDGTIKRAVDLRVGDGIAGHAYVLSEDQEQVLLGSMLGDGYITKEYSLRIDHGNAQRYYLDWKLGAFSSLKTKCKRRYIQDDFGERFTWQGRVNTCLAFRRARNAWYGSGDKQIPDDCFDRLSGLGLAVWFMDDATIDEHGYIKLYYQGFDYASRKKCADWFVAQGWRGNESQQIIKFDAESSRDIIARLAPYVVPCYAAGQTKRWVAGRTLQGRVQLTTVFVENVSRCVPSNKYKYDIEVGETHNFYLASGVLVHNCQTDDEKYESKCRLFLAGLRNDEDGRTVECRVLRDRALIYSTGLLDVGGNLVGEEVAPTIETKTIVHKASEALKESSGMKKPSKGRKKAFKKPAKKTTKTTKKRPKRPDKKITLGDTK